MTKGGDIDAVSGGHRQDGIARGENEFIAVDTDFIIHYCLPASCVPVCFSRLTDLSVKRRHDVA
jgi:hypothetical protein